MDTVKAVAIDAIAAIEEKPNPTETQLIVFVIMESKISPSHKLLRIFTIKS